MGMAVFLSLGHEAYPLVLDKYSHVVFAAAERYSRRISLSFTRYLLADHQFAIDIDLDFSKRGLIIYKLESRTTFLVLQYVPEQRSHCRAVCCLPRQSTGRPNIMSYVRLNIKDFWGQHYSKVTTLAIWENSLKITNYDLSCRSESISSRLLCRTYLW